MIKFGKKSSDIIDIKKNFITDNKKLFDWQKKLYKIYRLQPKRKFCKNCNRKLNGKKFEKLKIIYILCKYCEHLNGLYEDTFSLSKKFYETTEQKNYSKIYLEKEKINYKNRLNIIYLPKARFLIEALMKSTKSKNKIYNEIQYLDIGCGAGYFVSALNKLKVKKINGYDPSISMTKYGNKINNFKKLNYLSINQTLEIIKNTSFSECCVTMIGTLEHIYNSHKILSEIKKNKNIKYLYISVPCYSPSTFIELIFNTNFQRLMAPQHTHVFTYKSIRYMAKKYKFRIISEWWFGTDILDLFRNFIIEIYKKKIVNDEYFLFNKMFSEILDNMQLEIDKKKLSSEAHIIFKVNN